MKVKCNLCGQIYEITKIDADYAKLAKDKHAVYICDNCKGRVKVQAQEKKETFQHKD